MAFNSSPPKLEKTLQKEGSDASKDIFFSPFEIKGERWNQLHPYRFMVIDVNNNNKPVAGTKVSSITQTSYATGFDYYIKQENLNDWEFQLPISPQNITIQDNYAISVTPTMRGIVEEHNGIKFKNISISGTTGIWVSRKNADPSQASKDTAKKRFAESFFAGSIESLNRLKADTDRLKATFSGSHPYANVKKRDEPDTTETGYYQALRFSQFLERYAMAKKDPKNSGWRLVFDIPKENQSFIVTPLSFSLNKSIQKPMEYQFQLSLKAWKRIDLKSPAPTAVTKDLQGLSLDDLQKINSAIRQARRTLSQALNLVKAVRSDFQSPLTALRQTALAIKDAIGLLITVVDLPGQIIEDYKESIKESFDILNSIGADPELPSSAVAQINEVGTKIAQSKVVNEGLSSLQVKNQAAGKDLAQYDSIDPVNQVFSNSDEYFDFFDSIAVDDLILSPEQIAKLDDIKLEASLLTINDFRSFKNDLIKLADEISNSYGANTELYSQIYNKPLPKTRPIQMSIEENEILISIYDAVQAYDELIKSKHYDDNKVESPLEFIGGYANSVGVDFVDYSSKYLAPVPFGLSIEEIAARYLGSPDRFLEIATLNGLRSPYIDEVGFVLPLLSNASDRRVTVTDIDKRLYIGQKISLYSNIVPITSRRITNIEASGSSVYVITLDGEADLDSLKVVDNASLKAYLPGTVNSQNQIYIPSNQPADEDDRIFPINHLAEDKLTRVSKIDFLLSDNNDVAINSVGDFRLANGMTNLIQALKIKIQTRKGTLLRHLDFGLGLTVGSSLADIQSGELAKELNALVTSDPRFAGIEKLEILLKGSTIEILMSVQIAGNTGVLPISFNVKI